MSVGTVFGDCASRHAYKLYLVRNLTKLDLTFFAISKHFHQALFHVQKK